MGSNFMRQVEEPQIELALSRKAQAVSVSLEIIRNQKTAAAAFTLACSTSGLEDKEIYISLGIDAGYFSNIKKGKATLQGDLTKAFCGLVGNHIYVEWLAYQVDCTLVMIKSAAERRAEEAEEKVRILTEILRGKP